MAKTLRLPFPLFWVETWGCGVLEGLWKIRLAALSLVLPSAVNGNCAWVRTAGLTPLYVCARAPLGWTRNTSFLGTGRKEPKLLLISDMPCIIHQIIVWVLGGTSFLLWGCILPLNTHGCGHQGWESSPQPSSMHPKIESCWLGVKGSWFLLSAPELSQLPS